MNNSQAVSRWLTWPWLNSHNQAGHFLYAAQTKRVNGPFFNCFVHFTKMDKTVSPWEATLRKPQQLHWSSSEATPQLFQMCVNRGGKQVDSGRIQPSRNFGRTGYSKNCDLQYNEPGKLLFVQNP